jgi:hypothetical protein
LLGLPARLFAQESAGPHAAFPSQEFSRVYDTVLWAHSDIDKVRALLEASPALANATIDWAFGDWETALGAASHMGLRDMAQLLLDYGARPDIFTFAMMGNLAAVRAAVEGRPGIQSTFGPHGISLLEHAKSGGETSQPVVDYLEKLGGADPSQANEAMLLGFEAYTGVYAWGSGKDERVTIKEGRGQLRLHYKQGFPKFLFHVGNHEFHPPLAIHVLIRFAVEAERATGLSILDPGVILTAKRVEA